MRGKNFSIWKLGLHLLLICLIAGCTTTQVQVQETKSAAPAAAPQYYGPKKRVAVMDFEYKGPAEWNAWKVGSGMSEMLITALHKTGRFIVVERKEMDEIFKEQALGVSGAVKEGTEAKIGELLGAQALVKGVITEFEETKTGAGIGGVFKGIAIGVGQVSGYVACDIRMYDATTGVILESHRSEGKVSKGAIAGAVVISGMTIGGAAFNKTCIGEATRKAIDDMVAFIVAKMEPIPWQGRVILAKGNEVYLNAGSGAGIKVGDSFDIYKRGEELIDPDTGLSLGFEQSKIGNIQVSKVEDKFSIAKITAGSGGVKGDLVRLPTAEPIAQPIVEKPKKEIVGPRVMVVIPETHLGRRIPDPAGETEIIKRFLEAGFDVVDQAQVQKIREDEVVARGWRDDKVAQELGRRYQAEVIIIGEAFSEFAATLEREMVSCRARVEAKAVETATGQILATDGREGSAADISENIAGKKALRDAGSELASYLIERIRIEWKEKPAAAPKPSEEEVVAPKAEEKKEFAVEGQIFENEGWEIKLVSYEILADGKIQFGFLYKNKLKKVERLRLSDPKVNTYLVDDLGYQYFYDSSSPITSETKDFPPGIPLRVLIAFPKLKAGVSSVNLAIRHDYGPGRPEKPFDVYFTEIELTR